MNNNPIDDADKAVQESAEEHREAVDALIDASIREATTERPIVLEDIYIPYFGPGDPGVVLPVELENGKRTMLLMSPELAHTIRDALEGLLEPDESPLADEDECGHHHHDHEPPSESFMHLMAARGALNVVASHQGEMRGKQVDRRLQAATAHALLGILAHMKEREADAVEAAILAPTAPSTAPSAKEYREGLGRCLDRQAYVGDTIEEIEKNARALAHSVFGNDAELYIKPNYTVFFTSDSTLAHVRDSGKRLWAFVTVDVVE